MSFVASRLEFRYSTKNNIHIIDKQTSFEHRHEILGSLNVSQVLFTKWLRKTSTTGIYKKNESPRVQKHTLLQRCPK